MKGCLLLLLCLTFAAGSLPANSSIYQPLIPPKAADITAFTNGLAPATGLRREASREQILRFLQRGRNNLNVDSWYALEYPARKGIDNCDGVMVDRQGRFYFWFLRSATTLKLETPDGHTALLQLP